MEKSTATYAGFGQGYAHRPGKRPRGAGPLVLPDGGAEYTSQGTTAPAAAAFQTFTTVVPAAKTPASSTTTPTPSTAAATTTTAPMTAW